MSFFNELKRRNVFRVAIAYLAGAWLLIEVAGTLFPAFGVPDWGVRFVVIVLALGFLPALIISWAYELTSEGLKREKDVVRDVSITHVTAKRLNGITIGLIMVALAFILVDRFWLGPRLATPATTIIDSSQISEPGTTKYQVQPKSIAVLPFVDMSENQDQGWFGDGLAEEILNTLARTPDLMVSSRTSSFKYRNTELDTPGIARELGVAQVLEGSVRRAGDRIRVTAKLIRAGDGFHVWSETFDRNTDDVISIQEDLAINIAKALKTTMDPEELERMLQAGTRSVEAYEHYLSGLALNTQLVGTSDFNLTIDALEHFDRAWEADPGFAAAHAESARIWQTQISYAWRRGGVINVTPQQALVNFRERMIAAVKNSPNETQRMLNEAELAVIDMRGTEAVQLLRHVLEILPNSLKATHALSIAATFANDKEAQLLAAKNYLRLGDVESIAEFINDIRYFVPSDHYVQIILEQVKRFPNVNSVIYQAHRTLLWAGEFEEAHRLYPRLASETGKSRLFVDARQACSLGDRQEAEHVLRLVQQEATFEETTWYFLLLLGEYEEAWRSLKVFESKQTPIVLGILLRYQQFDPRPFPTLMAILEREGIDWPPPREIPFACPPKDEE